MKNFAIATYFMDGLKLKIMKETDALSVLRTLAAGDAKDSETMKWISKFTDVETAIKLMEQTDMLVAIEEIK